MINNQNGYNNNNNNNFDEKKKEFEDVQTQLQAQVQAQAQIQGQGQEQKWHTHDIHTPAPESAAAKESVITLQELENEISQLTGLVAQKKFIGERLFPQIQQYEPRLAGKITGMLLEMDNSVGLRLIVDRELLLSKINEAIMTLHQHHQQEKLKHKFNPIYG